MPGGGFPDIDFKLWAINPFMPGDSTDYYLTVVSRTKYDILYNLS